MDVTFGSAVRSMVVARNRRASQDWTPPGQLRKAARLAAGLGNGPAVVVPDTGTPDPAKPLSAAPEPGKVDPAPATQSPVLRRWRRVPPETWFSEGASRLRKPASEVVQASSDVDQARAAAVAAQSAAQGAQAASGGSAATSTLLAVSGFTDGQQAIGMTGTPGLDLTA